MLLVLYQVGLQILVDRVDLPGQSRKVAIPLPSYQAIEVTGMIQNSSGKKDTTVQRDKYYQDLGDDFCDYFTSLSSGFERTNVRVTCHRWKIGFNRNLLFFSIVCR